jgi:hypothetical protein
MATRTLVTVSRVDNGSHTSGYNTISQGIAAASLAAFALGGHDAVSQARAFCDFYLRKARPNSITIEPSSKAWSITVRIYP